MFNNPISFRFVHQSVQRITCLGFVSVFGWVIALSHADAQVYPGYPPVAQPIPVQPAPGYSPVPQQSGFQTTVRLPWYQLLVQGKNTHDFGVVAKASLQERIFEFLNTTNADLYLSNARASCGCTIPTILTPHVKPGETAKVKAKFDTTTFSGDKGATLTVSAQKVGWQNGFQSNEYGELQFSVKGTIRKDVVFTPGVVRLDNFKSGTDSTQTIKVLYAGRPDWTITDVTCSNQYATTAFKEVSRNPQTGLTSYELTVKLNNNHPVGLIHDTISLRTNDPKTNGVSLEMLGRISSDLEAADVQLGVVRQGQPLTKRWIVRGSSPFQIVEIKSSDSRIQFQPSTGLKQLHVLTYTLDCSLPGEIDAQITLVTSSGGNPGTARNANFSAQIVPTTVVTE